MEMRAGTLAADIGLPPAQSAPLNFFRLPCRIGPAPFVLWDGHKGKPGIKEE